MPEKMQILIVDDEEQMLSAMEAVLGREGHSVFKARNGAEALTQLEKSRVDLVISDMRMPVMDGSQLLERLHKEQPRLPVVMITAYGTITQAVEAMKNGAYDFITKPFSAEDLEGVLSRLKSAAFSKPAEKQEKDSPRPSSSGISIVTGDPGFKKLLELLIAIAPSSASVLLQGESGTGKELLARLIHSSSGRQGQFVAVNCAALPENLLESELFGHEKGSFTGAHVQRIGKFEQANSGTILLDEITEMEPLLQAKLLRVLQEREVDRIGGTKPINIDVRVVATTNRDIRQAVKSGMFREDLYYRLNVVPLSVPALRERKGDVKLLAEHFVRRFSQDRIRNLAPALVEALSAHNWPGNIRELQNACERAVLLASGGELQVEQFLLNHSGKAVSSKADTESEEDTLQLYGGLTVADAERKLIFETLRVTGNNKSRAAEMLGISIRTLRNKLHEYGAQADD